jgi:hypothetical protein
VSEKSAHTHTQTETKTQARARAEAVSEARTFARNYISVNEPTFLRHADDFADLILQVGKDKAIKLANDAKRAGKIKNPYGWALEKAASNGHAPAPPRQPPGKVPS